MRAMFKPLIRSSNRTFYPPSRQISKGSLPIHGDYSLFLPLMMVAICITSR